MGLTSKHLPEFQSIYEPATQSRKPGRTLSRFCESYRTQMFDLVYHSWHASPSSIWTHFCRNKTVGVVWSFKLSPVQRRSGRNIFSSVEATSVYSLVRFRPFWFSAVQVNWVRCGSDHPSSDSTVGCRTYLGESINLDFVSCSCAAAAMANRFWIACTALGSCSFQ